MTDDFRKPPEPYKGPERRKVADRRQGNERREMIRFEPDKDDRRSRRVRRPTHRKGLSPRWRFH